MVSHSVGPIDALQNAVSFNYYANSNYSNEGLYARPAEEASKQEAYINGILVKEADSMANIYNTANPNAGATALKAIQQTTANSNK